MSDLRLRARSVTEIVDAAFQLYKRDPLEYILVTAVAYAPVIIAQLVFLRGVLTVSKASASFAGTYSVVAVLSIFVYALMAAVLSRFASDVYLGKPSSLREVLRSVVGLVPAVIAATFLYVFIWVIGFVPVIIGVAANVPVLAALGAPLAIIWIFYALARYFAVFQIIVLEQPNVLRAFQRSSALSRGRKGHILLTMLLVFVIFFMLSMATSMLSGIAAALSGNLAISTTVQSLFTVVAYPLIGITQVILYYDARIRAEGFDIELMASALDASAPSIS
jgi:hypothetical protein